MDIRTLFRRSSDLVYIRLALEDWTELPAKDSEDWAALSHVLQSHIAHRLGTVSEIDHNGVDVYLLVRPDLVSSIESAVTELEQVVTDPSWQPFVDFRRYAWVGGYHAESVPPGEKLASRPLEHPHRRWKREHLGRRLGRQLTQLWHEAPSPEVLGIQYVECASNRHYPCRANEVHFNVFYEKPEPGEDEAWVAAQMNTRLRIGEGSPLFESIGWEWGNPLHALVFSVPARLEPKLPDQVEIWWVTDVRQRITALPCRHSDSR